MYACVTVHSCPTTSGTEFRHLFFDLFFSFLICTPQEIRCLPGRVMGEGLGYVTAKHSRVLLFKETQGPIQQDPSKSYG